MKHDLLFVNMNQMNWLVATNTDIYATICLIEILFGNWCPVFNDAQDPVSKTTKFPWSHIGAKVEYWYPKPE